MEVLKTLGEEQEPTPELIKNGGFNSLLCYYEKEIKQISEIFGKYGGIISQTLSAKVLKTRL